MVIDWHQIRPFNGSQNNAFEELVCQLAREEFGNEGEFTRFGTPDGGLEAICKFDDGRVYGWQAKYFLYSFTSIQWQQIKDSFENAVTNYPNLTHFFLCVPLDRNNPCVKGKESFRNKWDNKVLEWKEWAKEKGREVDIKFWGSSELIGFLSLKKNEGRIYFWFQKKIFNSDWFKRQNKLAIEDLGRRYTPKFNIKLPISEKFKALSRDKKYNKDILNNINDILIQIYKEIPSLSKFPDLKNEAEKKFKHLRRKLNLNNYNIENKIPVNAISKCIRSFILKICKFAENKLVNENIDIKKDVDIILMYLNSLFDEILNSNEIKLFNGNVLWLTGEAGVGKSHLLADLINFRYDNNKFSLFFLGQQFTESSNLWRQIIDNKLNLGSDMSSNLFLSILDSIAEAQKERIFLVIDALNESRDKLLWQNNLNSFIREIQEHPYIGLILSIRNTYQEVIYEKLNPEIKKQICIIEHQGFAENGLIAIESFFDLYNLPYPTIPLLNREFNNPLYLKLYCENLQKQPNKIIPKGGIGINLLIFSYVQNVEREIAEEMDEPLSLNLVQRVINKIVEDNLNGICTDYVSIRQYIRKELQDVIDIDSVKKLINLLQKKGFLNTFTQNEKEFIYFTYERIGDFLSAQSILQDIANVHQFNNWLNTNQGQNFTFEFYQHQKLWEAFSVLIPEQLGFELFETDIWNNRGSQYRSNIINLVIRNLPWRRPESINVTHLTNFIIQNLDRVDNNIFIDSIYQLAIEPKNPLNSYYLNKLLFPMSMGDRDAQWSARLVSYLKNLQSYQNKFLAIKRLLEWCRQNKNKEYDIEMLSLIAISLCWVLPVTYIKQRNNALISLSYLFVNRLTLANKIFKLFEKINDPYILQGILAAIEAAALNSENLGGLKELANTIDNSIFNKANGEEICPNVIVRDHARYIIEFSLLKNEYSIEKVLQIRNRITPPYNSILPERLPTNEEIDNKFTTLHQQIITHSMRPGLGRNSGEYGDFGRYVFEASLRFWNESFKQVEGINANLLSNYACYLIFTKYGYDEDKHASFDKYISDNNRYDKIERIGKKYQWLALSEVLARVMDNYQVFVTENSHDKKNEWLKEIDEFALPKIQIYILPSNQEETFHYKLRKDLRFIAQDFWKKNQNIWIKNFKDIPDIPALIEQTINGEKWLVLKRIINQDEPDKLDFRKEFKNFRFSINGYFVKINEFNEVKSMIEKFSFHRIIKNEAFTIYNIDYKKFYLMQSFTGLPHNMWECIQLDSGTSELEKSFNILPCVINHKWEEIYGNKSYWAIIPCREIYNEMDLSCNDSFYEWANKNKEPICIFVNDVSENQYTLLIKKEPFLDFLSKNNLQIFWTFEGEKSFFKKCAGAGFDKYKTNELSGVYFLSGSDKKIKGKFSSMLNDYEDKNKGKKKFSSKINNNCKMKL
ncbi:hypothetical protein J3U75_08860 [Snodgrassella sp. B3088]|uniref:hypothetical protein n=1 Tax=Snodgrassella sp. B3088 TaxID=2818038 RepID=UPI00226ACD59|nr:hypothetical protein [Snodgrassella sp. B3088]MCX8749482.1 hypothetical protein [Snodgrassella sp. B3088]